MMQKIKQSLRDRYLVLMILFICLARFIFYKNSLIGVTYPDSGGYLGYSFREFFHLNIVNGRVPLYPALIRAAGWIFGREHILDGVVILQIAVSMFSLCYLYRTLKLLTNNTKYSLFMCAVYGTMPVVMNWDTVILTESLSLSLTLIFICQIVRFIGTPGTGTGMTCIALALLMTFVKPSFLPFNYALLVFWLMRFAVMRGERKCLLPLLIGSAAALAVIAVYSYLIYRTFGVFSVTPLAPRHLLAACLESGIYEVYPDQALVEQIRQIFTENNRVIGYETTTPVMDLLGGNQKTLEFAKYCIGRDPGGYWSYLIQLLYRQMNQSFSSYGGYQPTAGFFSFLKELQILVTVNWKIGYLYLFGIGEWIVTAYLAVRKRYFSWIHFGLAAFITGNILFVFIGTYGEFGRCLIHLFPFLFVSLAGFLYWGMRKIDGGERGASPFMLK